MAGDGSAALPLQSPKQIRLMLMGLTLATGMEFYMFDSMNLVLADLTGSLGVSTDEASWILTIYSGALFLGIPISFWFARYFGHKRFLLLSVVVFALASVGCMLSPDLSMMLFWRFIQGFAGAGLTVWWRASVYVIFKKPDRSRSMMRISTGLFLSSALGLILSGMITDNIDWRLIFIPPVIYAAGAVYLLVRYFPNVSPADEMKLSDDYVGMALIAIALMCLQVVLSRGHIDDWFESPRIVALSCISAVCSAAFVAWELCDYNKSPLWRLDLLRNRNVFSSLAIGFLTGMIISGSVFVLPEFLRNLSSQTYSATQTGWLMCTYALTAAALRPFVPRIIEMFGQRKVIAAALLMLLAAMLLFQRFLTTNTSGNYFVPPLMLYGACLTLLLPSVGSGTFAKMEQEKLLPGVSIYMTFRQFGATLGVALLTIILEERTTLHSSRLFDHLGLGGEMTRLWLSQAAQTVIERGGGSPFEGNSAAIALLRKVGLSQASTLSYADTFLFMAVMAICAICLIPAVPPTPVVKKTP